MILGSFEEISGGFVEASFNTGAEGALCLKLAGHFRYSVFMVEWLANLFKAKTPKDALGDRGENMAARHLRNRGFKIIMRNFTCEIGEIDIIARDGKTLVFLEVKTRAYDDPKPEAQVNSVKQGKIIRAAKYYLGRYGTPQPPSRFDVIAIVWPTGQPPIIRHTEHAFDASGY